MGFPRSHFVQAYVTAFLDLIYTRRCETCQTALPPYREKVARWLCDACLQTLPRIEGPCCSRCGEPYDGALGDVFTCGNCADLKLHFDFAVSAYLTDAHVRELVHRFKYQRELHLRGVLSCFLQEALETPRLAEIDPADWILVPVPLFHARQREREYNQAWELCLGLSKLTGLTAQNVLTRVRATTPQATLSRHQRIENLKGAFRIRRFWGQNQDVSRKNILLVDDVLTTGSTASECARVLRRHAGVEKVVVITVARG